MKARALQLNKLQNPKVFWTIVFGLILLAGLYAYLVNQTVWNVVSRQKSENAIASINSDVGTLENNYISMKNNVNLNLAQALGYTTTPDIKYITREKSLGRLSVNSVE